MFSSPSLIPDVSSARRRSSKSGLGVRGERARRRQLHVGRRRRRGPHEPQGTRQGRLQVTPIHYEIEKAVFEQELAPLKPVRQLLTEGLFDDTRAGEADQRLGLRDVQISPASRSSRSRRRWSDR